MDLWKQRALEAMGILLGRPADSMEVMVLLFVGAVSFILLFHAITKLMSFPVTSVALAAGTLLVLGAACVGGGAAALVYLGPLAWVREAHLVPWLPFAAAALAVPIVVAPALRLIHRSQYGQSLLALVMGVAALAATLALTHAIYGAIKSGDQELDRTRRRTGDVNRFINE